MTTDQMPTHAIVWAAQDAEGNDAVVHVSLTPQDPADPDLLVDMVGDALRIFHDLDVEVV